MGRAAGTFDVTLTPQEGGSGFGRMHIDKTFHGDLTGPAEGQMLMTRHDGGSAAYVALEQVRGRLAGRTGTFELVHRGLMRRGEGELSVAIVPDSGTGALKGITGQMTIDIASDGTHNYVLEYVLPE
ncbi:MAG: DUF3224 domain-containing protein [Myxococcales bacterium]|nr:DUF3224 domain-containing protein [Myxococcales bacterium]